MRWILIIASGKLVYYLCVSSIKTTSSLGLVIIEEKKGTFRRVSQISTDTNSDS